MFEFMKALLSDPNSVLISFSTVFGLLTTVLTALIGHHLWFHKIGQHWRYVAIGALIVVITTVGRFFMNFIIQSMGRFEDGIWLIYATNILSSLGHILFLYGLYRFIFDTMRSAKGEVETERKGPFIR